MSVSYESELEEIRLTNGGHLLPEQVVGYAREHEDSELHQRFEWDDGEAAEKWRINQARELIRAVIRIIPNPKGSPFITRAYISLPTERVTNLGYRTIEDVLSDPASEEEMLAALRAEAKALQTKYRALEFLVPVFKDFMSKLKKKFPPGKGRRPDPEHRPDV